MVEIEKTGGNYASKGLAGTALGFGIGGAAARHGDLMPVPRDPAHGCGGDGSGADDAQPHIPSSISGPPCGSPLQISLTNRSAS